MIILETAIEDGKVMQDFDLESLPTEGEHSQMVKDPSVGKDSGSKDCINLPSSIELVEEPITRTPPHWEPAVHN